MTPKDAARFWSKVDKSAGPDACWPWTGCTDKDGYGLFKCAGRMVRAHRLASDVTGKTLARHTCDNPPCCNPAHLTHGTQKDNAQDRNDRGRSAPQDGERNGNAVLTAAQVEAIRKRFVRQSRQNGAAALAREFGVSRSCVSLVANGVHWLDAKVTL